tara:strand:- start:340 stop:933 length:594 start_codon:yes stop_codon:yes gene_type:complete
MGINSTGVAYNFGQLGSTYLKEDDQTVIAPEGMAIVAITFVGANDSQINSLIAKDATNFANSASSAHSTGRTTRTVDQGNATTNKIIFDQENFVSGSDQIEIGDEVYDGATQALHGTVTVLNPDGDNTKEIQISASVAITNNETLVFVKPNKVGHRGVGGMTLASGEVFASGTTIYGRWDSVKLNNNDSRAIIYFGE